MDTGSAILFSLFFGFFPMFLFAAFVYWIDRYEKEPLLLLGAVFLWGAVVAAGSAFIINTLLGLGVYLATGSQAATELTTGSLIAPVVEESLKGLAVLVVFLIFYKEFDSILDGIIYAAITALGFAATENVYYIYTYGAAQSGLGGAIFMVFVRVILVGWQHPFFTSFTGIGLAITRLTRNWFIKIIAPIAGWCLAVFAHSFHNTVATFLSGFGGMALGALIDWSGWLLMFLFIIWALYREQQWIVHQLREEVSYGVISPAQYRVACSAWAQSWTRWMALFSGGYSNTNQFYKTATELAFKKQHLTTMGDEGGNMAAIQRLRAELARLSPLARA